MDQNPFDKPDFCCVQGMVPLYDATAATGGLEVVPGTHLPKAQATIREKCGAGGDWCVLPPGMYADAHRRSVPQL